MRDLLESLDKITEEPPRQRPGAGAAPKRTGPVGGPTRANATRPFVRSPEMPADQASARGTQAIAAAPAPAPSKPQPRAKVKATAANTKDFDKTMALQKSLIAKGADIKADGLMGPQTRAAMAKFAPPKLAAVPAGTTPQQSGGRGGEFGDPSKIRPGIAQRSPSMANRAQSQGGMDRGQAMAAVATPTQQQRVQKSNAALRKDIDNAKSATSGFLDKIGAGISSLFKPSPQSVKGRNQARAKAGGAGRIQQAKAGGFQSGVAGGTDLNTF